MPTHTANPSAAGATADERLLFPVLGPLYRQAEPVIYAVLRIAFAVVLLTHGLPKALGISHGSMVDPMAGSINLMQKVLGLPFASELAFLVMLLETLGALMLLLGLWTRPVALAFTLEMTGISIALGPTWPWVDRGIEYPVLMAFLAFYMAVRGGGRFALDRWIKYSV